jgi:hypothetical protein
MIEFKYTKEKDAENLLKASHSKNSTKVTRTQAAYIERYGSEFTQEHASAFVAAHTAALNLDMEAACREVEARWRVIEKEFLGRLSGIFGTDLSDLQARAYLTIDQRCTYNVAERYFFVYAQSKDTNAIIMHELLHLPTHDIFGDRGLLPEQFNAFKESLTELLNIECADLLGESVDKGYPQHAALRKIVHDTWLTSKDIEQVYAACAATFTEQ